MAKERLMAIILGLIMVSSVAGYAFIQNPGNRQNTQTPTIPSIVDKELTSSEKIYILQTGRILIQNFYNEGCTACEKSTEALKNFVTMYKDYIVLESVMILSNNTNETSKLQLIGASGDIIDIDPANVTDDFMFNLFCEQAIMKPRECLINNVLKNPALEPGPAPEVNKTENITANASSENTGNLTDNVSANISANNITNSTEA